MRRLAQIHTHPFGWVGHSDYDDEKAFSQREGAISIVVPHFAAVRPAHPNAVFICADQGESVGVAPPGSHTPGATS